jgi:hypothetical protein
MGKAVNRVFSPVAKAVTNVTKAVVQPIYNATLKQIPGVDNALVGLDKAVGSTIPGGWGTVASIAATFIPGSQFAANGLLSGITRTQLATGLGALAGSGVMKKGHEFNLQGAIMGGAMAYGGAKLSEGLQAAGAAKAAEEAAKGGAASGIGSLSPEQLGTLTSGDTGILNQLSAGMEGGAGSGLQVAPETIPGAIPNLAGPPAVTAPIPGSIAAQNAYELQGLQEGYQSAYREPSMLDKIGTSISEAPKNVGNFLDKATTASTYNDLGSGTMDFLKGTGSNIADAGQGIANLSGFGAQTGAQSAAIDALTNKFGMGSATALLMGSSGLMALEEQKKALRDQLAAGTIAQSEYNAALAEINRQEQFARETVAANPLRTDSGIAGSLSGSGSDSSAAYETLYDATPSSAGTLYASTPSRSGVYARGGEVQHYLGGGILKAVGSAVSGGGGGGFGGLTGAVIGAIKDIEAQKEAERKAEAAVNVGKEAVKNNPFLTSNNETPIAINIGLRSLNRGRPEDLLYDNRGPKSKNIEYGLPSYALGGVVADDYSGVGPLDQGFNFNYPQQNQSSSYPSPSNFDRPQPGPTTPSSYYQNTGLDSFGGYGSGMGYAAGGYAMGGYAAGGEPRFLSGGGDGMSDSIRASINGTQEARLADGEFVIPADVVSHLGNGSSKAGAKQLYAMMDRARTARTGRKSQGKQINPRKYMPA